MAACKYCGEEIEWVQGEDDRWVAYIDGERHFCQQRPKTARRPPAREVKPKPQPVADTTDHYELILALNRLAAEVKELRRVIEEQHSSL